MSSKKKHEKKLKARTPDLPGMPEKPAIVKIAEEYVFQKGVLEGEEEKLDHIKDKIYVEMKSRGQKSFAYNHDGIVHVFEISEKAEKLIVKKQK